MNKYEKLANEIINLSGGENNFKSVKNCMTRVRINYVDINKVDKEAISELPGVHGINEADSFQIIVGPGNSVKVQEAINSIIGESPTADNEADGEKTGFLKLLANIFVPIIPAIIASGFLQGINNIFITNAKVEAITNNIAATDTLAPYQVVLQSNGLLQLNTVLGILGDATFAFLAIYVGMTAAKQFKTDPILGAVLGAATTMPALTILGLVPGEGGLFGVIFGVWLMSLMDKFLKKMIPNVLDVVLRPTFTLLIVGSLYLFVIMPIAGVISDTIINGIMYLINNTGMLGGFVLASAFPALIATGLHHGLSPIHMELINSTGATPIFPIQIMSNAGLLGAGLAIFVLTKNPKVKEIAKGCLPTTLLAVGEPTMYGLVIPSGFGFITASLGAGIAGALVRYFDIQSSAFGAAGLSAIPLMADGKYGQYLLCYVVGVSAAFVMTFAYAKIKNKDL